ncbi:MAG: protein translocase subunit SecD [Actinomycetota bacterium]
MVKRLSITIVCTIVVVAAALVGNIVAGNKPSLGLDLQGGASITLQPVGDYTPESLEKAVEIIERRVNSLGVAEPEITRQGDNVVVNLPGVDDQQRALDIIGRQGEVLLRPVLQVGTTNTDATTTTVGGATETTTPDTVDPAQPTGPGDARRSVPSTTIAETTTTVSDASTTTVPQIAVSNDPNDPTANAVLEGDAGAVFLVGPAGASGQVFNNDASADITTGNWVVTVGLRDGALGEDLWNALTTKCFNREPSCPTGQIAIVLDGKVISAPVVQEAVFTGGNVQITGDFTEAEARDLAKILEYGAVPVRFDVATVQTVSPTLGEDSLRAALISGLIGVLLVILFFFFYYRLLTIVVLGGLVVSGALLWSVISYISRSNGLALTLSGAAGIIVSIGVTVDSYVVFFERLKDDLHAGKSLKGSAQRSFQAAFRTILAADAVSFLGALVLWYLTVGSVRGFAFFLGLSTLTDVIVAYYFTRPAVLLLSRTKLLRGKKVLGVATREVVA